MGILTDPNAWIAFVTLTVLEIVLGIDNIVFISIVSSKLPEDKRDRARRIGLLLAMVMRVLLLLSLSWLMGLTEPLMSPFGKDVSVRDLILLVGGLFLVYKAVMEIHEKLEGEGEEESSKKPATLASVVWTIVLLDIVFSLDSVITAIGMADQIAVMVAAVIVAVGVMMVFAKSVGDFVEKHPTVKMLALAFLVLIGVNLIAEGAGQHIPKGYTYFAMAFSVVVEMLNLKLRKRQTVHLHRKFEDH